MRVDILEYQWTPEYSHGYVAREARYWTRSTSWLKVFLLSVFLRCTVTVRANWCMYFQHKTSPMPSSVPCSKKPAPKECVGWVVDHLSNGPDTIPVSMWVLWVPLSSNVAWSMDFSERYVLFIHFFATIHDVTIWLRVKYGLCHTRFIRTWLDVALGIHKIKRDLWYLRVQEWTKQLSIINPMNNW